MLFETKYPVSDGNDNAMVTRASLLTKGRTTCSKSGVATTQYTRERVFQPMGVELSQLKVAQGTVQHMGEASVANTMVAPCRLVMVAQGTV